MEGREKLLVEGYVGVGGWRRRDWGQATPWLRQSPSSETHRVRPVRVGAFLDDPGCPSFPPPRTAKKNISGFEGPSNPSLPNRTLDR